MSTSKPVIVVTWMKVRSNANSKKWMVSEFMSSPTNKTVGRSKKALGGMGTTSHQNQFSFVVFFQILPLYSPESNKSQWLSGDTQRAETLERPIHTTLGGNSGLSTKHFALNNLISGLCLFVDQNVREDSAEVDLALAGAQPRSRTQQNNKQTNKQTKEFSHQTAKNKNKNKDKQRNQRFQFAGHNCKLCKNSKPEIEKVHKLLLQTTDKFQNLCASFGEKKDSTFGNNFQANFNLRAEDLKIAFAEITDKEDQEKIDENEEERGFADSN